MKKGFPNKILGIFSYGWRDRGKVGITLIVDNHANCTVCVLCRTRARVGVENNKAFLFCPKCIVRLSPPPEIN